MARSTPGDRRNGLRLIGAGGLGAPLLGLIMSVQGRSAGEFVLLGAAAVAAIALGTWLLFRGT